MQLSHIGSTLRVQVLTELLAYNLLVLLVLLSILLFHIVRVLVVIHRDLFIFGLLIFRAFHINLNLIIIIISISLRFQIVILNSGRFEF